MATNPSTIYAVPKGKTRLHMHVDANILSDNSNWPYFWTDLEIDACQSFRSFTATGNVLYDRKKATEY